MDDNNIYELIGRSFSGEGTQSELVAIELWKNESEENLIIYNHLKEVWIQTKLENINDRTDAVYAKVLKKIEEESNATIRQRSRKTHFWITMARMAAVFVIAITTAMYVYLNGKVDNTEIQVIDNEIIKTNPIGQKLKVFLPDGSVAILNSQSSISYVGSFDEDSRKVELIGEAFFEVMPDENRPFIVRTKNITTTVLGTSFNINAYSDEKNTVSIATGKVKVSLNDQNGEHYLLADAGKCIEFDSLTNNIQLITLNVDDLIAWKDGIIMFNDNTLPQIVEKLSKWYGVEFKIMGKPTENWRFSGKFQNEYLSNILESISYGRVFDYQINDKSVTIKFNKN
jgi:transmembrane sensor